MNSGFKKIKEIKFCLPDKLSGISKEEVLDQIVELAGENEEIGFAGFKEKKYLKNFLPHFIFGDSEEVSLPDVSKYIEDIKKCLNNATSKCDDLFKLPKLYIFVFPTQDKFVEEQMKGVNGFAPYQKTIHLYINSEIKGWFNELPKTFAHEIAHAISHSLFKWETILDTLVFEGIAEHFRKKTIGGERAPWAKAISEKKAEDIIENLERKELLNIEDQNLYFDLFFGNDEFPQWAGYTIGYVIVKTVLENSGEDINSLIKTEPKKVFELYKRFSK